MSNNYTQRNDEAIECECCGHAYSSSYMTETYTATRGGEVITHCHDCRPVSDKHGPNKAR